MPLRRRTSFPSPGFGRWRSGTLVEIDGRAFHSGPAEFERDRWRQNDLVNAWWRVLRFTARMVEETPHLVIATIRAALAA